MNVFVILDHRRVLSMTEIHIKKHSSITQISLKNFALNIAFQYNIGDSDYIICDGDILPNGSLTLHLTLLEKIYALLLDGIRLKLTKIYYQNTLSNLLPDNNYRKLFILSTIYKFARIKTF